MIARICVIDFMRIFFPDFRLNRSSSGNRVSETLTSVGNPYVFYFLSQSPRFAIHNTEPLASQHNPAVTVINTVVPSADYAVDPTASPVIAFVETVARLAGRWV